MAKRTVSFQVRDDIRCALVNNLLVLHLLSTWLSLKDAMRVQMLLHADGTIQVHYKKIRFDGNFFIGLLHNETPRHFNQAEFYYGASCREDCYSFGCFYGV